ncbi:MAG: DUF481 domain-containing protein [Bryobacteraceae bacterium]
MKRLVQSFSLALALFAGTALWADQVEMKNGDRLSGSIQKFDGKNLVIKSEFAGVVTIPWDAVVAVTSKDPLYVELKDGQTVVGGILSRDSKIEIETKETGRVVTAKDAITSIRNKEEQAAYDLEIERFRNPRLVDLWTGFVDLGLANASGNSNTSSLNVAANASRETSRDKIGVHFTSLYASSDASGESLVTANAIRGGISYSMNVTPKLYVFGSTDLEFDEFQDLDLRFAPAGGFGYALLKTQRSRFDVLGGMSLNREFFSTGLDRTSGEMLLGQEYAVKLNGKTTFGEKLVFYPNVTDTGSYRMNFDASLSTALFRWLAWHVTLSDRLMSNPVAGREKNDVLLTTGLRITFAK